jgi:hypothetical protein
VEDDARVVDETVDYFLTTVEKYDHFWVGRNFLFVNCPFEKRLAVVVVLREEVVEEVCWPFFVAPLLLLFQLLLP